MDDSETLSLISKGNTLGIFQLESTGMRNVLRELQPENLLFKFFINNLIRVPGKLESPDYISSALPADNMHWLPFGQYHHNIVPYEA